MACVVHQAILVLKMILMRFNNMIKIRNLKRLQACIRLAFGQEELDFQPSGPTRLILLWTLLSECADPETVLLSLLCIVLWWCRGLQDPSDLAEGHRLPAVEADAPRRGGRKDPRSLPRAHKAEARQVLEEKGCLHLQHHPSPKARMSSGLGMAGRAF